MDDYGNYFKKLYDDLLEQFKDKPNLEVFQKAMARQLNEVYAFFYALQTMRRLQDAEGVQLDGIGNIVDLTRTDALIWSNTAGQTVPMDDNLYRMYLWFKIFLNTSEGTYADIVRVLKMFWPYTPVYYSEEIEKPATMFFTTPRLPIGADLRMLQIVTRVKAAGVALHFIVPTLEEDVEVYFATGTGYWLRQFIVCDTEPMPTDAGDYYVTAGLVNIQQNITLDAQAPTMVENLLAGGSFASAGGVVASRVAKWDGASWSALGDGGGLATNVNNMAQDKKGNIYVNTGGLNGLDIKLMKFDGISWSEFANFGPNTSGSLATVYPFFGPDGTMYAGRSWTNVDRTARLYKLNDSTNEWLEIGAFASGGTGTALSPTIRCHVFDREGSLYVAGNFTAVNGIRTVSVAKYDGERWHNLSGGVNSELHVVNAIAIDKDEIVYIGGNFAGVGGITANRIARWDGMSWSALGNGFATSGSSGVVDILFDPDGLMWVCNINNPDNTGIQGIAKWDGKKWLEFDSTITTLMTFTAMAMKSNGEIFVAGNWITIGGVNARYIAKFDGTTWSPLGTGMASSNIFKLLIIEEPPP